MFVLWKFITYWVKKIFGYKGVLSSIDLGGLQNGVYCIHILYESNTVAKKIVLNKP